MCILQDNNDRANLAIATNLLVEKTIFIRRDVTKAIQKGVLKKGTLEERHIKDKTKAICRQYMKEYILKIGFPIKFKGMMVLYCLV